MQCSHHNPKELPFCRPQQRVLKSVQYSYSSVSAEI